MRPVFVLALLAAIAVAAVIGWIQDRRAERRRMEYVRKKYYGQPPGKEEGHERRP